MRQRPEGITKGKQRSREAGIKKKLEKSKTCGTCLVNVPTHLVGTRNPRIAGYGETFFKTFPTTECE
eukprot:scaffold2306_cov132-Cylindrotheca_fusiformis.AAC.2